MTMTLVVPRHTLHAPQPAAASPFRRLNQSNDFLRPCCRRRIYITGAANPAFGLELPTPRWTIIQGLRAPFTLDIAIQI